MKVIIILCVTLLLAGCGSNGTFLDDFLVLSGTNMSQIDQYFDLNDQQQKTLEKNLDRDLYRIRKERFNTMAKTLRKIEKSAQAPSPDFMSTAFVDMREQYQVASAYFRDSTVRLVADLKQSQLSGFRDHVQKDIRSYRENPTRVNDLNTELVSRYQKGLEYWLGDLTPAQKNSLVQFTKDHQFPWAEKMKNREKILDEFVKVQNKPAEMRKFCERFVSDYDSMRTPSYATAVSDYDRQFQAFLDGFWVTVTPDQRSHLRELLLNRADKLEALAKK